MKKNIGFVSTRFAGTDGVSLEASKWAEIFEKKGYNCFWFAGQLEKNPEKSFLVPEAHFQHPINLLIHDKIWGQNVRKPVITDALDGLHTAC